MANLIIFVSKNGEKEIKTQFLKMFFHFVILFFAKLQKIIQTKKKKKKHCLVRLLTSVG
jgi:hypothetical protein